MGNRKCFQSKSLLLSKVNKVNQDTEGAVASQFHQTSLYEVTCINIAAYSNFLHAISQR